MPDESGPSARTIWLALAGAVLPFLTIAIGWWIAEAALKDSDNASWDRASRWVLRATLAAVAVGLVCCIPLLRYLRGPGGSILATFVGLVYVVGLFFFDLWRYVNTSAPFP